MEAWNPNIVVVREWCPWWWWCHGVVVSWRWGVAVVVSRWCRRGSVDAVVVVVQYRVVVKKGKGGKGVKVRGEKNRTIAAVRHGTVVARRWHKNDSG